MYDARNMNFPQPIESFHCPACEGVIPNDLVFSEVDKQTGLRHVQAHCVHCAKTFERDFASVQGVYVPLDQVKLVTNAAKLNGIYRRVAKITNTQLAQSA